MFCSLRHIHFRVISVTISAVITRRFWILTEVFQDVISQAARCAAVPFHYLKSFFITLLYKFYILLGYICELLMFKKKPIDDNILRRIKKYAS